MSATRLNEVRKWLNGRMLYAEGLRLYCDYGYLIHSNTLYAAMQQRLAANPDSAKLLDLVKLIYTHLVATEQPKPTTQTPVAAAKPKAATLNTNSEISQRETKWKTLFKEFALLHEHGFSIASGTCKESNDFVKQKMKLWYAITELQNEIDFIEKYGTLPQSKAPPPQPKAAIPESAVEQMRLLKNIPDLISQTKKRLSKNEALLMQENDSRKLKSLAEKINKQKARIEELQAQKELLKKRLK